MVSISFARKLYITLLIFSFIVISAHGVSAHARMGSEKTGAPCPKITRIPSVLKSFSGFQYPDHLTIETDVLVWPDDKQMLHEQLMNMMRENLTRDVRVWPDDKKMLHEHLMNRMKENLAKDVLIGNGEIVADSAYFFALHEPKNAAEEKGFQLPSL